MKRLQILDCRFQIFFQELFPAIRYIFFCQKKQKKDVAAIRAREIVSKTAFVDLDFFILISKQKITLFLKPDSADIHSASAELLRQFAVARVHSVLTNDGR